MPHAFSKWVYTLFPSQAPRAKETGDLLVQGPVPNALNIAGRFALTRSSSRATASPPNARSFLEILPLEVRSLIWEEALGGHTFHLEMQDTRLGAAFCVSADPSSCNRGSNRGSVAGYACRSRGPHNRMPLEMPDEIGKLLNLFVDLQTDASKHLLMRRHDKIASK